jgi:8-oxo-dGTP pyrophosphatase MutT (NUDIX family)
MSAAPPDIESIRHHYACVVLLTEAGRVIGVRRDDVATIDNPGKTAFFGGAVEEGETPEYAAWRELTLEETNIAIPANRLKHYKDDVCWRSLTGEWEVRHFYYAHIREADLTRLQVFEGAGWTIISGPDDKSLVEDHRAIVATLFADLRLGRL